MPQRAMKCVGGRIGVGCCRRPASRSRPPRGFPPPPIKALTSGHRSGEVDMRIPMRMPRLMQTGRKMAVRISLAAALVAIIGGLSIARLAAPSSAAGESQPIPDQREHDAAAVLAQAQTPASPPPTIPVVKPRTQTVSDTLEVTGNATAVNQVKLIARVVGFLEKIHFEDGAVVKKGDLLFTIQQDQYKAQLAQALAQLHGQQAALIYAKTEVVRYTALLKRDAATQVDVDHWNFEQASAEANIAGAQAQVALAQLNLG